MFDKTKFGLICKIVVSIILFIAFFVATAICFINNDMATGLLTTYATVCVGGIGFDLLLDYWEYTDDDKDG